MYTELKGAMRGKKGVVVINTPLGVVVRHYETDIVVASLGSVVLSSGGHFSATTKRHVNNCLEALGVNAYVYQRNYTWYIMDNSTEQVFFDGYVVAY